MVLRNAENSGKIMVENATHRSRAPIGYSGLWRRFWQKDPVLNPCFFYGDCTTAPLTDSSHTRVESSGGRAGRACNLSWRDQKYTKTRYMRHGERRHRTDNQWGSLRKKGYGGFRARVIIDGQNSPALVRTRETINTPFSSLPHLAAGFPLSTNGNVTKGEPSDIM